MLSDTELLKEIESGALRVDPMVKDQCIQPASLDLTLDVDFAEFSTKLGKFNVIDPCRTNTWQDSSPDVTNFSKPQYLLPSMGFCLARTHERIALANHLVARVEGKSTLGRHGLAVHITAGFIDPGFEGHITLELFNFNKCPILLTAGMKICQLAVSRVDGAVRRPYGHPELGSKYQGQTGTTPAK